MSVFKDTFSIALEIFPNDNTNIPFPNAVLTGVTNGVGLNQLKDTGTDFVALGIQVGDIVFNQSDTTYAYVTAVENDRLLISENIFLNGGEGYTIYQGVNQGCYIYIGSTINGVDMEVVTLGGDTVKFNYLRSGTVLPVQVLKVTGNTSVSNLIALW
jgi:hypothetical protein